MNSLSFRFLIQLQVDLLWRLQLAIKMWYTIRPALCRMESAVHDKMCPASTREWPTSWIGSQRKWQQINGKTLRFRFFLHFVNIFFIRKNTQKLYIMLVRYRRPHDGNLIFTISLNNFFPQVYQQWNWSVHSLGSWNLKTFQPAMRGSTKIRLKIRRCPTKLLNYKNYSFFHCIYNAQF